MKPWQARIGLLVVAVIWAIGYIATDLAIVHISVTQMQVYRFTTGALILCIVFHKKLKKINKRTIIYGVSLGLLFFSAMTIHSAALETTTVSKNAFLVVMNVIWVPVLMYLIFKTKIEKHLIFGVVVMIIGFFILVFNIDFFNLSSSITSLKGEAKLVWGDYLTLFSSIIFAAHIVLIGYSVRRDDAINLVIIQLTTAALLSLISCLIKGEPILNIDQATFNAALPPVAYLAISSAIGFSGQIAFQEFLPASNSAIIFSTESLFASLFSVMIGLEPLTSGLVFGGVIITLGIVWAETGFDFKEKS